jgi:hypothetical protein
LCVSGKQPKIEMREGNIIILILLLKSCSCILNVKRNLSKISLKGYNLNLKANLLIPPPQSHDSTNATYKYIMYVIEEASLHKPRINQ